MKRRKFIQNSALGSAAMAFPKTINDYFSNDMNQVGIQLFSLPKLLEQDFRAGVEMLATMGYKELEFFGPFPFSAESAKQRWRAITPMLGFSGSGYFGYSPQEVRLILEEFGLNAVSTHTDIDTLTNHSALIGNASKTMGFEYAGIAMIPEERRTSIDDYKRMAAIFNQIGAEAKKNGFKFLYHNHGYGLQEIEGTIPLNLLLENTDPELVFFEMDIFWTVAGGADPIDYLEAYPDRYHLMHLKDMKEDVRFSGDGGTPDQWMPLFPYMTNTGEGVLDLKGIIAAAEKAAVRHFFVEQDLVAEPDIALQKSIDYLLEL